jgi:hypothetical protein
MRSFGTPANASAANATASQAGLTMTYTGHGFDACPGEPLGAGFLSAMQVWSTNSPYRVWNLYMGGTSVASCGTLTADILRQLTQQGWLFIPTWVGLQAPCHNYLSRRMSLLRP